MEGANSRHTSPVYSTLFTKEIRVISYKQCISDDDVHKNMMEIDLLDSIS